MHSSGLWCRLYFRYIPTQVVKLIRIGHALLMLNMLIFLIKSQSPLLTYVIRKEWVQWILRPFYFSVKRNFFSNISVNQTEKKSWLCQCLSMCQTFVYIVVLRFFCWRIWSKGIVMSPIMEKHSKMQLIALKYQFQKLNVWIKK